MTSPADQFNQRTIAEFRANHGRVGGNFAGAPLLLLHTVGAHSGQPRVNPVMYLDDGDRYLVFASKSGSDRNPDWYWTCWPTRKRPSRWMTRRSRCTPPS